MRYRPIDVLRKFALRQNIEHLVATSEHAVWLNLTFWENVTAKAYASRCWDKFCHIIVRRYPNFRLVGVWARQRRGAWHIHAVCNQRFDIEWLRNKAMRCGFGQSFYLQELDERPTTPEKLARYISGYCTDKNGLNPETDKGVRRMIFVGKEVKVVSMRYRSCLKRVATLGRELEREIVSEEIRGESAYIRQKRLADVQRKSYETWGEWYRRNRDKWFDIGWQSLSDEVQNEYLQLDRTCEIYFETGKWCYF